MSTLLQTLREFGMLEYGSHIDGALVRKLIGIELPATGTKAMFDQASLRELAAIDAVRDELLDEGKYLAGVRDGYRVLLPSENAQQVEACISHAKAKLRRADRLERSTPAQSAGAPSQHAARLLMLSRGAKKWRPEQDPPDVAELPS